MGFQIEDDVLDIQSWDHFIPGNARIMRKKDVGVYIDCSARYSFRCCPLYQSGSMMPPVKTIKSRHHLDSLGSIYLIFLNMFFVNALKIEFCIRAQ